MADLVVENIPAAYLKSKNIVKIWVGGELLYGSSYTWAQYTYEENFFFFRVAVLISLRFIHVFIKKAII